jgi:hypothetical protein
MANDGKATDGTSAVYEGTSDDEYTDNTSAVYQGTTNEEDPNENLVYWRSY